MRLFGSLPLWSSLRRWLRYRAALRQLRQLSAGELRDLGLRRAELRAIARSVCHGPAAAAAPDIAGAAPQAGA